MVLAPETLTELAKYGVHDPSDLLVTPRFADAMKVQAEWIGTNLSRILQDAISSATGDEDDLTITVTDPGGLSTITTVFERTSPTLLLQAVIDRGEVSSEGQIVRSVAIPWFEIVRMLQRDPDLAFKIPPRKWEEIIAGAYKKAGFDEVILTPSSGDFGRDVIAVKRGLGKVRVIDQVKAYARGHLVTANDVRALMGVLQTDGACKGFLSTTSDFAPLLRSDPLISPFIPNRLELINGESLISRLNELAGGVRE